MLFSVFLIVTVSGSLFRSCDSTVVSKCPANEEWNTCPVPCNNDSCNDVPYLKGSCDSLVRPTCNPKCWCKPNYARNKNGVCIPVASCPVPKCPANEEWNACPVPCYNDSCDDVPYRSASCDSLVRPTCYPKCWCKPNYARNQNGVCIPVASCPNYVPPPPPPPQCGINEYYDACAPQCPIQSCRRYPCDPIPNQPCYGGCRCVNGYLRNSSGQCVPPSQCDDAILVAESIVDSPSADVDGNDPPPEPSSNDTVAKPSSVCPRRCKSTCTVPNPQNCKGFKNCTCKNGYIYPNANNNTCIPIYECPENGGCNGDRNAVIQERALACPSTCQLPNQGYCNSLSPPVGCVCKSGYILNRPGGKCIRVESCPGGNPCGQNKTFVSCKIQCPINFCPTSDDERFYPCDPVWPCPSGCVCQSGYKVSNNICVLPEDCPPVTCTRENEEWNRCPSPCFSDSCYDVYLRTAPCNTLVTPTCSPKCWCKPDYARTDNGTCVPISECPPNPN